MKLEQMRQIAADLGMPGGELPPLAGAGGTWTIPTSTSAGGVSALIPTAGAEAGTISQVRPAAQTGSSVFTLVSGAETVITPGIEPTLMERWKFYSFRVPVAMLASLKPAAEQTGIRYIFRLKLLITVTNANAPAQAFESGKPTNFYQYAADTVFSTSEEVELTGPALLKAAEEGTYFGNAVLGGELVNGIELPHGKRLMLVLAFSTNQASTGAGSPQAILSAIREGGAGGSTKGAQGGLTYVAEDLTGHRVIS